MGIALGLGLPSQVFAETITVDTLNDGAGADIDGMRTFRWAIERANSNLDDADTIVFAEALTAEADSENVIQIVLTTMPLAIDEELRIEAPVTDESFFVDIVTDPDLVPDTGSFFEINRTITLNNVDLRSASTLINGGVDGGENDLDLVYEIDDFRHDITWNLFESAVDFPKDGDARIVKTGTGELALFLSNSNYSGGTLLVDGVLRTDTDGLRGDIQICADGMGDDAGYASNSCGDALLIFEMPGIRIDEDLFSEPRSQDGTYAGNIIGEEVGGENGRVVKTGPGQLTLTGDNDYAGGTYIMQGEVVGDLDAIQGDVHICPGVPRVEDLNNGIAIDCGTPLQSKLTFDVDTDGTYSDTLHGAGIVGKDGDGRLTFDTNQVSFFGDVEVKRGELTVDGELGVAGSVSTRVDVVVEDGATLSGAGKIVGNVTIERGAALEGSLDDVLEIEGELDLAGRLDPKNQSLQTTTAQVRRGAEIVVDPFIAGGPGRLVTSGAVTLNGGSVLFALEPDNIDALPNEYYTVIESPDPVAGELSRVEEVGGQELGFALFDVTLLYNEPNCTAGGNVCVRAGFSPILEDDARTKNQRVLARALDRAYVCAQDPNAPGCGISQKTANEFNDVYTNFGVRSSEIPDILDEIAGEEYAAFADMRAAGSTRFNRSISRRFDLERRQRSQADDATEPPSSRAPNGGSASIPAFSSSARPQPRWMTLGAGALNLQDDRGFTDYRNRRFPWRRPKPEEPMPAERHVGAGGWTGWMDVHGVLGETSGSNEADDVDYRIYGPLLGLDYGLTDDLTLGLTAGFTRNELKTPHSATKGTGTTYQVGLYGAAMFGNLYLTAAGRYAHSNMSTDRRIRFEDIDLDAKADFDASDASAFFEVAYGFSFPFEIMIQPVASLAYNRLHQESFEERRLGSLNVDIDSQTVDTLQSDIGVRMGVLGRQSDGGYLLPQLRVTYEREYLDNDRDISANLGAAGDGGEFELTGISLPRDRAVIGVSSEVGVSNSTNLFVDYDLRAAKDFLEHSLSFGVRAIW